MFTIERNEDWCFGVDIFLDSKVRFFNFKLFNIEITFCLWDAYRDLTPILDCFGWWADCCALGREQDCRHKSICNEDWVRSGGRVGGLYDKEIEKQKNQEHV